LQEKIHRMVGEGIKPEYDRLEKIFFSIRDRKKRLMEKFSEDANSKGHSLAEELVNLRRVILDSGEKNAI